VLYAAPHGGVEAASSRLVAAAGDEI